MASLSEDHSYFMNRLSTVTPSSEGGGGDGTQDYAGEQVPDAAAAANSRQDQTAVEDTLPTLVDLPTLSDECATISADDVQTAELHPVSLQDLQQLQASSTDHLPQLGLFQGPLGPFLSVGPPPLTSLPYITTSDYHLSTPTGNPIATSGLINYGAAAAEMRVCPFPTGCFPPTLSTSYCFPPPPGPPSVVSCGEMIPPIPQSSMFGVYPSDTSLRLSSSPSPSDLNITASQMTLTGCLPLTLNPSCVGLFPPPPQLPPLLSSLPDLISAMPPPIVASASNPIVQPMTTAPAAGSPVVYPTVVVSAAGLLNVAMSKDIVVEMTLDRAIRVVNLAHRSVAATNGRGNASCIHHPAARIFQDRTTTQVELHDERRAKLTTDEMVFGTGRRGVWSERQRASTGAAYGPKCYRLKRHGLEATTSPDLTDQLSQDMSVTLLFSSSSYGPHLISQYEEIAQKSRYRFYRNGAVTAYINGVRIHQIACGDVIVSSGRKYLRVSPISGLTRIVTHFVEMTIEQNWTVRVRRGGHRLLASGQLFLLANDKFEFGLDHYIRPFFRPVAQRQETIICRRAPTNNFSQRKGFLEPQSSDSRLLSQCMIAPSYSSISACTDLAAASTGSSQVDCRASQQSYPTMLFPPTAASPLLPFLMPPAHHGWSSLPPSCAVPHQDRQVLEQSSTAHAAAAAAYSNNDLFHGRRKSDLLLPPFSCNLQQ